MVMLGTINIGEKLQTIIYHGEILLKISKTQKMLHCLFHSYLIKGAQAKMSFFNDRLFIPALFGVRIKVRCVLECSLNVDHFRCLNFSIWLILAPSTQGQGK